MRTTLQCLWYSYQMEKPVERNEEKEELLSRLRTNEEKLRTDLNEVQKDALKNYEDCLDTISSISAKEAFIKGVCFATNYLIEALYTN